MRISELHAHLHDLAVERATAWLEGVEEPLYLGDLEREIQLTLAMYVGAAVTEIAILRAELSGPLVG